MIKFLKLSKRGKIIASILCIIAVIGVFYLKFRAKPKDMPVSTNVSTEIVKLDSINIKASFFGKVRTFESVTLCSELVGKVVYMKKDGSHTNKGELIVELDSAEAEAKCMKARGRKEEEEIKLKNVETLFKDGYETENHVEQQRAKVLTARGELKEAEAFLSKHRIKAPFSGKVGLHTQSIGATITHNTKLVTITNLQNLQIEFVVSDAEMRSLGGIDKIKNSKIFVTLSGQLIAMPAQFLAAETVLDSETNSTTIRAGLIVSDDFIVQPGQIGDVMVNVGTKDNVITLPESALIKSHGAEYVYKVIEEMAIMTPVQSGIKDGNRVEITQGLSVGDVVIISGQYALYDGQRVMAA